MQPTFFGTKSRWGFAICFLLVVFILPRILLAHLHPDGGEPEHIGRFDVSLEIQENSSVRVRESITYDFGLFEKHGIYRDIPVKYADRFGTLKNTQTKVRSVVDEKGNTYQYTESFENGKLHIKIGDPNKTLSGVHTYVITYTVQSAIGYFEDFDELYWNLTGNDWPVAIEATSFKLILPQAVPWRDWRFACYVGSFGSTQSCGSKESQKSLHPEDELVQSLAFESEHLLNPGEGITVAFGFPKGVVHEPTMIERILNFILGNSIVFLPLAVLGVMAWLWWTRGRDPKGRGVIISEYDLPKELSLLESAGLLDNRVTAQDISAAVIDLAVKGYIRIERTVEENFLKDKEDYVFHRLGTNPPVGSLEESLLEALFGEGLTEAQQAAVTQALKSPWLQSIPTLKKFFEKVNLTKPTVSLPKTSVKLTDLKNKFYTHVQSLEQATFTSLVAKGYYAENPRNVVGKYILIGVLALFASFFFGLVQNGGGFGVVMIGLSALVYFIFAALMPRVTKNGALIKEQLLGLKEYLQIAEKNRIEFHNAPEKTPELFEKLLPAAMLLGVTAIWAKEFEGLAMNPPEWYSDASGAPFSALSFSSGLNSFSSAASSTLASAPSGSGSGGGGSSGGGGGGGGGGSW